MQIKNNNQLSGYSWGYIREKGTKRYVLEEGVIYWGGSLFLLSALLIRVLYGIFNEKLLLVLGLGSCMAGFIFGLSSWYALETLYKHNVQKNKKRSVLRKAQLTVHRVETDFGTSATSTKKVPPFVFGYSRKSKK